MLTSRDLPQLDHRQSDAAPAIARRCALTIGLALVGGALLSNAPTGSVTGPATVLRSTASLDDRAEWLRFRDLFVTANGRVVDTGNGRGSSSEAQSYALLLADWADDRDGFERVLNWTEAGLSRPSSRLHAWVCRCGELLPPFQTGQGRCATCGLAYRMQEDRLVLQEPS